MAELPLYGTQVTATVDDEVFEDLSRFRWRVGNGRVVRNGDYPGTTVSLHRQVMQLALGDNHIVVARDNNYLNCTRSNLYVTTRRERPTNPKGRPRQDRSKDQVLRDDDSGIAAIVYENGRPVLRSLPRNRISRERLERYREEQAELEASNE